MSVASVSEVCFAVCFQHADGHGDAPRLEHDFVDFQDLEEVLRDGGADDDVGAGGDQVEVLHGGRHWVLENVVWLLVANYPRIV